MKKYFVYFILCNLFILSTAITCAEEPGVRIHYKTITIENKSEDSILYFYSPIKVDMDIIYGFGWSDNLVCLNPKETSNRISIKEDGSEILYLTIVKQRTLDKYTKEEIIEKDIAEYYTYTYDYLKWRDFKIVYTGEQQQDSINLKEEQYERKDTIN